MCKNVPGSNSIQDIHSSFLDSIRQFYYPPEFRIAAPGLPMQGVEYIQVDDQPTENVPPKEQPVHKHQKHDDDKLVAEFATCLWYLKTKLFKHDWHTHEVDQATEASEDPRTRRALGRLNKCIDVLTEHGIEIHDPTHKRYPPGGEAMMRPIQFLPTDEIAFEMVTETITPIVFRDDRLVQRGEVFVAVPKEPQAAVPQESNEPAQTSETQTTDSSPDTVENPSVVEDEKEQISSDQPQ